MTAKQLTTGSLILLALFTGCSVKVSDNKTTSAQQNVQVSSPQQVQEQKPEPLQFKKISFDEALKESSATGKLVFMDAYTVWCGPCKKMDREVFTDPKVAAYFNENFINLHMDMEAGEGIALTTKYDIQFYPTLLFIDHKGDVVKKVIGYQSADQLLQLGKSVQKI